MLVTERTKTIYQIIIKKPIPKKKNMLSILKNCTVGLINYIISYKKKRPLYI